MALLGQLTNNSSFDDVAEAIIKESLRRGHKPDQAIANLSTAIQESGLRMVYHPNGKWGGYYQQDGGYKERDDPNGNIRGYMDRLDVKLRSPGASPDPFKNAFWLQQRPSEKSADDAYNDPDARRAYYTEIKKHIAKATELYNRFSTGGKVDMPVSGDPVWLEDVLRPALGDRLKTLPGWKESGVGGVMGNITHIMWHHTGNSNADANSIRNGRPDLSGPLSQLHISKTGIVTIVAVGPCNHAGRGAWPGLPTNNANVHSIGIECAWPDVRADGSYDKNQRWPDAQIIAMRDTAAALTKHLKVPVENNISHAMWAGPAQGKWDPGNFSIPWFIGEVKKKMDGVFDKPVQPPIVPPVAPPILPPPPNERTVAQLVQEIWDQHRGIAGKGWPQLGDKTIVDSLAELHQKMDAIYDLLRNKS